MVFKLIQGTNWLLWTHIHFEHRNGMVNLKRVVIGLSVCFVMAGCSSINTKELIGGLAAGAVNTKVGYNKHQCTTIKSRCVQGHYEEWQTSDGVPGCSCKNHD